MSFVFSPRAALYAASKVLLSSVSLTGSAFPGLHCTSSAYLALLLIMSVSSLTFHYWPLRSCSLPLVGGHVRADWQPLGGQQDLVGLIQPERKGDRERGSGFNSWCLMVLQQRLGLDCMSAFLNVRVPFVSLVCGFGGHSRCVFSLNNTFMF